MSFPWSAPSNSQYVLEHALNLFRFADPHGIIASLCFSTDSSYSEPPDVQQQLNHYQSAALARNNNNVSPIPLSGSAAGMEKTEAILNCEFCEFSSGYIQSIRRHYRDKHGGKKLFKCKDCSFYTGFK